MWHSIGFSSMLLVLMFALVQSVPSQARPLETNQSISSSMVATVVDDPQASFDSPPPPVPSHIIVKRFADKPEQIPDEKVEEELLKLFAEEESKKKKQKGFWGGLKTAFNSWENLGTKHSGIFSGYKKKSEYFSDKKESKADAFLQKIMPKRLAELEKRKRAEEQRKAQSTPAPDTPSFGENVDMLTLIMLALCMVVLFVILIIQCIYNCVFRSSKSFKRKKRNFITTLSQLAEVWSLEKRRQKNKRKKKKRH